MIKRTLEKKCPIIFKLWYVKFRIFNFKIVYLAKFSVDFKNLGFKFKFGRFQLK